MKLILGWNGTIEAPNTKQIETILREMPGGENSFVILELKAGQFIQTHGAAGSGFLLEHWENGKGHSCTTTDLSMDTVVHLFRSYAQGDDAWRNSVSWEETGGISGTKIKQGKPRYTRKGIMRLVLFAGLFLLTCIVFTPLGLMMGGLVTVVPGMLIYVDLHNQKLHYALPSPLFTVLVNLILIPLVFGILTTLPWKDWFDWISIFPLGAFSLLLFWWVRRLIQLIQLQRYGVEEKPSRVWSEQYEVMGEAGSFVRTRIVYQYANGQTGRREPYGGRPEEKRLYVRYLPDQPGVHRLIRK